MFWQSVRISCVIQKETIVKTSYYLLSSYRYLSQRKQIKRRLRRHSPEQNGEDIDLRDHQTGEKSSVSERHFEDITNTIKKNIKKPSRESRTPNYENEKSLRIIENVSAEFDSLTWSNLAPCSSNLGVKSRYGFLEGNTQEIENRHELSPSEQVSYDNR